MDSILKNNIIKFFEVIAIYLILTSITIVARLFFFNSFDYLFVIYLFIIISFGFVTGILIIDKDNSFLGKLYNLKFFKFTNFILKRTTDDNDYTFSAMLVFIAFIIPLLTFNYTSKGLLLFDCICIFIFFATGVKATKNEFGITLSTKKVILGIISFTCLLIICNFVKAVSSLKNLIFVFSLLFMLISIVVRNQDNLSEVFKRRGIEASKMQTIIRNYNLYISLLLFLVILVALNGKVIFEFLTNILKSFVAFLLNLLPEGSESEVIEENISKGSSSSFVGDTSYQLEHPFKYFIEDIIRNFLIIYILIKLIDLFFKNIKKLIDKISSYLHKLFSKKNKVIPSIPIEYYDEVNYIKKVEVEKATFSELKFRKLQKLFSKTTDPILKIRLGYKIMLVYLRKSSVISNSLTTGEIKDNFSTPINTNDIANISKIYEDTIYGNKIADSDKINDFSNNLKTLESIK